MIMQVTCKLCQSEHDHFLDGRLQHITQGVTRAQKLVTGKDVFIEVKLSNACNNFINGCIN